METVRISRSGFGKIRRGAFALPNSRFATSRLDEIEDVVCNIVTPHKLVPTGRGTEAHAEFEHYGQNDLGLFHIRYGRSLSVELLGDHIDNFVTFVMSTSGRVTFASAARNCRCRQPMD